MILSGSKRDIFFVSGTRFSKIQRTFRAQKAICKRPACSVKLFFSYVVKGIKIKITAKFRVSRRLCFENTKRIMSPETFEKQAPDPIFLPKTLIPDPENDEHFDP